MIVEGYLVSYLWGQFQNHTLSGFHSLPALPLQPTVSYIFDSGLLFCLHNTLFNISLCEVTWNTIMYKNAKYHSVQPFPAFCLLNESCTLKVHVVSCYPCPICVAIDFIMFFFPYIITINTIIIMNNNSNNNHIAVVVLDYFEKHTFPL